ncbi:MAG: hypothetical protein P1U46_00850 [Patescibacteria group bacterium]|nr:hypothetical protein [Patescibacteria group bacterium]
MKLVPTSHGFELPGYLTIPFSNSSINMSSNSFSSSITLFFTSIRGIFLPIFGIITLFS